MVYSYLIWRKVANEWHKTGSCLNKMEYGAIKADIGTCII